MTAVNKEIETEITFARQRQRRQLQHKLSPHRLALVVGLRNPEWNSNLQDPFAILVDEDDAGLVIPSLARVCLYHQH